MSAASVGAPCASAAAVPPLAASDALLSEHDGVRRQGNAWAAGMGRWDIFYAVVLAATLVIVEAGSPFGPGKVAAAVALGAMVPWYLLVGRPHIRSGWPSTAARGTIYLTGIVVLFAIAAYQQPNTWFMAFALCPQCYQVTTARRAIVPVTALILIGGASTGFTDPSPSGIATAAALTATGIAFSVVYSGYIIRIIVQSEERASLIAQLDATRVELAEVSRQAGVLAERQRLAADIHDTLAQGFSSILMLVQAADAQLGPEPAAVRAQLQLAAQTARENLAEARTLVAGLAPAHLQAGTLAEALRRLTERSGTELGIQARFDVVGADRLLPAATEVVLLRTGQEALANVRKHAAAAHVNVRLSFAEQRVRLEVTDDGVGFDPALVNGGYGLRGMRGRVDEAGGTVTVRSAPAKGTSVLVEVPVVEATA